MTIETDHLPNYAGRTDVDDLIASELDAAGIEVGRYEFLREQGEVKTAVRGSLHGWSFNRAWYYWVAKGPGIEVEAAERLHADYGQEVRVAGRYGCPSPREWYKGLAVGDYHVDSKSGLKALADTIRLLVDKPAALSPVSPSRAGDPNIIGDRYVHRKGGTYRKLFEARIQTDEPLQDMAWVVVYQGEKDGSLWARRRAEFDDGRFTFLGSAPSALTSAAQPVSNPYTLPEGAAGQSVSGPGTAADEPVCSNCGRDLIGGPRIAGGQTEPGEVFCGNACYDQHIADGCPLETGTSYRAPTPPATAPGGGAAGAVSVEEVERLKSDLAEARDQKADAESMLTAWLNTKALLASATAEPLRNAVLNYVRTSRVGGMPSDISYAVETAFNDMQRLGIFSAIMTQAVETTIRDRIAAPQTKDGVREAGLLADQIIAALSLHGFENDADAARVLYGQREGTVRSLSRALKSPTNPDKPGREGEGSDAKDAARYRYLRDHCSSHYPVTWEQPAEWSIGWEFQQSTPAEAHGSFDFLIDQDIARRATAKTEAEVHEEQQPTNEAMKKSQDKTETAHPCGCSATRCCREHML